MKKTSFLGCIAPVCLGFLLLGCARDQAQAIKLSVPYVEQNPNDCGAATLSMLLKFYDISVPLDEIEGYLFVPALEGTTPELIADFAAKKGLFLGKGHQNWAFLVNKVQQGVPSIVFFGPTEADRSGHFAVVTGINGALDRIRLHNGARENRWMLQENFMELWGRGRHTVLWSDEPQHLGVDKGPANQEL